MTYILSIVFIILGGAFEPNGHLFCEYLVEQYEILNFFEGPTSDFEVVTYMSKLKGVMGAQNTKFPKS